MSIICMLIHTAHNTNYALKDTKILYQKIPSQSIVLFCAYMQNNFNKVTSSNYIRSYLVVTGKNL